MKRRLCQLLAFAALALRLAGDAGDIADAIRNVDEATNAPRPKLDPKRIINDSNSFLKEREPEMNAEEFALYEKMVTLLTTDPQLAVRLLEGMLSESKELPSPAFEFILGNAYYNSSQVDKAETRYKSAVARYPTFIRAWNNLGVLYYSAARYAEAAPCFAKSVSLGDHDAVTFGLLGYSLEKGQDLVAAELAFMQASATDPVNPDWKEGLMRICIAGKQVARAEALVKNLIKDHPREPRYWLTYANILLSDGRKVEAMTRLEAAAGTGVGGPDVLAELGDLYASEHLPAEAIATYDKLRAVAPDLGTKRLFTYADMLVSTGRLDSAQELLARVEKSVAAADRLPFLQVRANLAMAQKKWSAARADLNAIIDAAPLDGRALLTLGRSYAAEDDSTRAIIAWESAARIPETKYLASLELANAELKNRHYTKTVDYLQQALALERTDAVEDYLARVRSMIPPTDSETHATP